MRLPIVIHNETPSGNIEIEAELGDTYGKLCGPAMREVAAVMEKAGKEHIKHRLLKVISGGKRNSA